MIYVTKADYVKDYTIQLSFSDHKQGLVDLSDILQNDHRPIFNELMDKAKFRKFHLEADTIVWENGLDLAPEYLYSKISDLNAGL